MMNRFFYHFSSPSFFIPLLFAPFTILLIFSQNAVPGDLLYPYKRGVEILILAAASVNPTTKAYFQTSLADRRYTEAEMLLLASGDVSALDTFVEEIRQTENTIADVSEGQKKEELKETLIAKIDNYQIRLTQVETQVANNQAAALVQPIETGQSGLQQAQEEFVEQTAVSTPVSVRRTAKEQTLLPTSRITPTATPFLRPTHGSTTVLVTSMPPTTTAAEQPPSVTTVSVAVTDTKEALEQIKEKIKREREEQKRQMELQKQQEREHKKEEEDEKQKELQQKRESQEGRQERKK